jgi:hypothetical protein
MSTDPDIDLKEDRLFHIRETLIHKCVCAPKGWSAERVSDEATRMNAPGTSANRWVVSDPGTMDDDNPFKTNPLPCNDDPERVHWLLNC